jgi:hypothetical protein
MRFTRICLAVSLVVLTCFAAAQEMAKMAPKKSGTSDAGYTAKALVAAPSGIAKNAGVARFDKDGKMQTLRESKNGFTCMVIMDNPMCADANSMAFFDALMKKETPPDTLGLTYMLSGDKGASNTDPTADKKTADNHWVVTGPHVMIVGPGAKSLGLSEAADADPTKPYMMWAGTPYEHAMIPVSSTKPATTAKSATPKP